MKKLFFLTLFLLVLAPCSLEAAQIRGHFRRDGTYVYPYRRTNPDRNPYNNYGFPGNYNPNTGRVAPGNPNTYLYRYYNKPHSSGSGASGNYYLPNPYGNR